MSYLERGYLDGDGDVLAGEPTVPSAPANLPAAPSSMVRLPGGILIPRTTAYLIAGIVLALLVVWYLRKRKRQEAEDA